MHCRAFNFNFYKKSIATLKTVWAFQGVSHFSNAIPQFIQSQHHGDLILSFSIFGETRCWWFFSKYKNSTSGLNEANFLQLAMDGPNVNWLVLSKLDNMLIANGRERTVNIGSWGFQTSWLPNWKLKRWLEHW